MRGITHILQKKISVDKKNAVAFFASLSMMFFINPCQAQTLSYTSPVCADISTMPAIKSPGFPAGGTYSSTPSGLTLSQSSGQITVFVSVPGTYTVTYFGSSCNCVITATVQINPLPTISITNMSICAGTPTVEFKANPASGLTYTWMPGGATTPDIIVNANQVAQNYTLSVSDENGCKNKVVKSGTVFPVVPISIQGANNVCAGKPVALTATGAQSYTWNSGFVGTSITVTPAVTTTYVVNSKNSNGCLSTASKQVVVNTAPQLFSDFYTLCSGKSVNLVADAVPGSGVTFSWQPGSYIGKSYAVTPSVTTEYTVYASRAGCTSTLPVYVEVNKSHTATIGFNYNSDNVVCRKNLNVSPSLADNFGTGGIFKSDLMQVDPNSGAILSDSLDSGSYVVTYSLATKGCTVGGAYAVTVLVADPPKLVVSPDQKIRPGEAATLTAKGGGTYTWSNWEWLSCSDCETTLASPPESMQFCVSTQLNGCHANDCVIVEVVCQNDGDLSVPSAFTPNGDRVNDKFCLQGWNRCNTSFNVRIYDRWGQLIFESEDPAFCWDGTFKGAELNAGVFTYTIVSTFIDMPKVRKSGYITLIR